MKPTTTPTTARNNNDQKLCMSQQQTCLDQPASHENEPKVIAQFELQRRNEANPEERFVRGLD